MALQGSIDTFALDDVLRLVASTAKTGRLSLRGTRRQGELGDLDGRLLDGSVTTDHRVGDLYELVFELLRFEDGDFEFDAEHVDGIDGVEPAEVEDAEDEVERFREFLEDMLPEDAQQVLDNMNGIRDRVKGDFQEKVRVLNEVTSSWLKPRN